MLGINADEFLSDDRIFEAAEIGKIHAKGLLENPQKTQGKKAKPVYSNRQQNIVARVKALQGKPIK